MDDPQPSRLSASVFDIMAQQYFQTICQLVVFYNVLTARIVLGPLVSSTFSISIRADVQSKFCLPVSLRWLFSPPLFRQFLRHNLRIKLEDLRIVVM